MVDATGNEIKIKRKKKLNAKEKKINEYNQKKYQMMKS